MSSNKHRKGDMIHERIGNTKRNAGVFSGSKFVRKAGMTITYTNYNKINQPDKQEWV